MHNRKSYQNYMAWVYFTKNSILEISCVYERETV